MKSIHQAVRVSFTPGFDQGLGSLPSWNPQTEELNQSCPSEFWSEASWFCAIAQQSSDLIGAVSLEGDWRYLNPSGKRLFGEMPSFELGLDQVRRQLWKDTIVPKLYEVGEWQGAFALLRSSELIWFESQWFLLRDPTTNQPSGFATISRVIESPQPNSERLQQALERERSYHRQKTGFLAATAHELRAPLAVISTSIDILRSTISVKSDSQHKHFQRIRSKVKQMAQMLEDLLLLSRTEHVEVAVSPTEIDLVRFCAELVKEAQASTSRHEIVFSAEASVQRVQIDSTLFERIVANLLSNSIKYSPQGGTIHCNVQLESNSLTLQIVDQGIGIPSNEQSQLFQAFYRAQNASTIPGTGLGLAIVKRCVDLLGGQIAIESAIGSGTCFTVQIPI